MKQGIQNMKKSSKSATDKPTSRRKTYSPPRVLSSEKLEAAAATCDPAVPPVGKFDNVQCAPPYGS